MPRRENKTKLSPREKLKVAYFSEIRGVDQSVLADMFNVNSARVNEAIQVVRKALGITGNGGNDGSDDS